MARLAAFDIESMFERTRVQNGMLPKDEVVIQATIEATASKTISVRSAKDHEPTTLMTLSEVYERFLSDPARSISDRSMLAHHTTRRVVEDVLGASTPITSIEREDCRDLLDTLRWMPRNLAKKFSGINVRDAANSARNNSEIRTINTTNVNAYMSRFATMLNWAVVEDYLGKNPARGLRIAGSVHPKDRRQPFAAWQLHNIFHAPIYVGCKDEQHGYAVSGNTIASGARYWVPLIALFSGMRLNEICQLDVSDIRSLDDVQCLVISEQSISGTTDKSLKTKSSERIVPMHPSLAELGLIKFVQSKKAAGSLKLFDDLPLGRRGFRSVSFSRWFSRFLVSAGAAADRTCFHSFRHGFRDSARNAGIDRDVTLRLGGWVTGGSGSESAGNYGAGYRPKILYDAIGQIEFPDLDLSHLLKRQNQV
ncbi:hypothetical protein EH31_06475 [Erythrobacter longus]|uniref:Tyr recombinase domain-containing protein n=1 Tax=Erythrobacter longus TaxID=1044 RepID=A0A074MQ64_ERYLO|nr:hypothetical protein EH31_06475 [Erythrobacter longus]